MPWPILCHTDSIQGPATATLHKTHTVLLAAPRVDRALFRASRGRTMMASGTTVEATPVEVHSMAGRLHGNKVRTLLVEVHLHKCDGVHLQAETGLHATSFTTVPRRVERILTDHEVPTAHHRQDSRVRHHAIDHDRPCTSI